MSKRDRFYTTEIGGKTFYGMAGTSEPYISEPDDAPRRGFVALGDQAEINWIEAERLDGLRFSEAGYYVCKYDSGQPRISLSGLNARDVARLADEFGLEIALARPADDHLYDRAAPSFWDTPAGRGLLVWSAKHPRLAKADASRAPYLRDWSNQIASAGVA